jgi:hypothetical protein
MYSASESYLDAIRACILAQGMLADECLATAGLAIEGRDIQWEAAPLDRAERNARSIDVKCAYLLEERQPALAELRQILSLLRINDELCEIAKLAFAVARQWPSSRGLIWTGRGYLEVSARLAQVRCLLRRSMEAVAGLDPEAVDCIREAAQTNPDRQNLSLELEQAVRYRSESAFQLAVLFCASIQLEFALGHVGKIAEHVAYIVTGDIRQSGRPLPVKRHIHAIHSSLGQMEESTFLMEPAVGAACALATFPVG